MKRSEKINLFICIDMLYFNYFTFDEVFKSCSREEVADCVKSGHLDDLAVIIQFLDCFRDKIGFPIHITSSFRNKEHNKLVNGSSTSQHMLGQAVDFYVEGMPISSVYEHLKDYLTNDTGFGRWFGQVIIYPSFIHLALRCEAHKTLTFYDKRKC